MNILLMKMMCEENKKENTMFIKPEKLGNPKPERQPKPKYRRVKPVSDKRKHELQVYAKLRPVFLEENQKCIRCGGKATEIHHAKGKIGKLLILGPFFRAVCRDCHNWIHANLYEAVQLGYSEYRNR